MTTFKLLAEETVMPDDSVMYGMYIYIVDNVFTRSHWHEVTVAEYKRLEKVKEVRRCNLFGHPGAKLGDRAEEEVKAIGERPKKEKGEMTRADTAELIAKRMK